MTTHLENVYDLVCKLRYEIAAAAIYSGVLDQKKIDNVLEGVAKWALVNLENESNFINNKEEIKNNQ